MSDVLDVLYNALWVLGLAVLLAVWSYARYIAQFNHIRLRDKLAELKYALVLNIGLLLFLFGMALTEDRLFVRILWILLSVAVVVESVMRIQINKQGNKGSHGNN